MRTRRKDADGLSLVRGHIMVPPAEIPTDDALPAPPSDQQLPPGKLPGVVWATGWVSFFADFSTEMTYAVLPAFYTVTLHLNVLWMGFIEGCAEAIVSITKLFSGHWSDRTGGRKWWMLAGYGLSAMSKPLLPLSGGGAGALALRGADRLGKGIRGAPRDALISCCIGAKQRGHAFGIQRALDHGGALAGAFVAAGLLYFGLVTVPQLFWWSLLPGVVSLAIIVFVIHETPKRIDVGDVAIPPRAPAISLADSWRTQSPPMRRYLLVLAIFALGNSTDMLLLKLARDQWIAVGVSESNATAMLPLLWAWLHVIKSGASAWGGRLSDRIGRPRALRAGWLVYAVTYAGFALISGLVAPWVLFAVYGVYFGLVEGAERALVSDLSPNPDRRGGAYGLFHFVTGIISLPASLLCGTLWFTLGPAVAFLTGAALALIAASLLPWALNVPHHG